MIACGEPLEFADWTAPVAEEVRIIEYAHRPPEARREWIELEPDGEFGTTADGSLYRPIALAADATGRLYVADLGDHQVKVYGTDTEHLFDLGRQGQGPGEFVGPIALAVAGSTLVVADETRLSFWTLDGEHLRDRATSSFSPSQMFGLADGSVVVGYPQLDEAMGRQVSKFARWDPEGQETLVYATLNDPESGFYSGRSSDVHISVSAGMAWPSIAASPNDDVYLTQADEYQLLAYDREGAPRWALHTTMSRPALSRREIDRAMEGVHRRFPEATESSIDWPSSSSALSRIWVDGHGHLYVMLYAAPELEAQEREVDVYSPAGDRLFAGRIMLPAGAWTGVFAATGDFMFFLARDVETEEWSVLRHRLVEPFE